MDGAVTLRDFEIMNTLFPVGNAQLFVDEAHAMWLLFAWRPRDAYAVGPRARPGCKRSLKRSRHQALIRRCLPVHANFLIIITDTNTSHVVDEHIYS